MSFWSELRAPVLPAPAPLPRRLDAALCAALAVLGFFLPFSVAGVSLTLAVLLVLALLAAPSWWRSAPWRDPVVAVGLLLFAYILVHTLWTSGWNANAWRSINRYHELVMALVLLGLFRLVSRRELFFWGLGCSVVLYAAAHWVAMVWQPLHDYLELRHISAGFSMAVTAFVLLEKARSSSARPWPLRAAAAFLALTVLFAIDGRTGHLVMLLLVGCVAWLHSPKRWRWAAVVALPLVVVALALGSTAVQKRVTETLAGSQPEPWGDLSSTGIRIELLRNGLHLAARHGLAGGGYAEYLRLHEQSAQELYASDPVRRPFLERHWIHAQNPHNEYLMQLVGGGLAGLALFVAWLALSMLRQGHSRTARAALIGVGLAFGFGCLFNSLLMDFAEGHFYVALMTWLLAQSLDPPTAATAPA